MHLFYAEQQSSSIEPSIKSYQFKKNKFFNFKIKLKTSRPVDFKTVFSLGDCKM